MPKIELDITRANKTIIFFRNRMLLSLINTIQIFITIRIINFHVDNIPILFFLCLKNMYIFGIYLNNIINQFICQDSKNILIICKRRYFLFFVNKNNKIDVDIYLIKA